MVGATIIFVRALSPEDASATSSTTTTVEGTDGSSTTSTTSTLPPTETSIVDPALEEYLLELDALEATATELIERAVTINTAWDEREIDFGTTRNQLQELSDDTAAFVLAVEASTPTAFPELEPAHLDILFAARAMDEAALAMIEGLLDPDSSAGRIEALEEYTLAGQDALDSIDAVRVQAGVDPSSRPDPPTDTTADTGTEDGEADDTATEDTSTEDTSTEDTSTEDTSGEDT
jgi:hypothetical protein